MAEHSQPVDQRSYLEIFVLTLHVVLDQGHTSVRPCALKKKTANLAEAVQRGFEHFFYIPFNCVPLLSGMFPSNLTTL